MTLKDLYVVYDINEDKICSVHATMQRANDVEIRMNSQQDYRNYTVTTLESAIDWLTNKCTNGDC